MAIGPKLYWIDWRTIVRKTFSASTLPLCVLCLLGLFGCGANGQYLTGDLLGGQPAGQPTVPSNGIVQDWSMRHVVYPRVGEINALNAVQHDPRALLSWQEAEREDLRRARTPQRFVDAPVETTRDWSISLGIGGVAASMYPAKFGFDITAAASCPNDFAVFPVNATGSVTQPNIVAFNNLYSGTVPSAGICNRAGPPPGDLGTSATTFWSYNISAAGGQVTTSPALSLDGTKIAFVETGSGVAHFHVLAWKSGDGVDVTTPNAQNVLKPVSITSGFAALAPVAASGTVTDLALGAANDTLSSPFVDYADDVAYIGNDSGVLFRVINVFCTNASCTGGGTPAPSLDPGWGSGGALTVGGTCLGKLSGAVVDGGTGHIFVGCSDGKVYGFTSAGAALANPSATAGNGTAMGGIVDPPLIDAVNGFLYVVSGTSGVSGPSVMVQAKTADLSSPVTATLGIGGIFNLHAPAFNAAYISSGFSSVANVQGTTSSNTSPGTISNWQILEWADSGVAGSPVTLYGVGFNSSHIMTSGAAGNFLQISPSTAVEFSPVTEFLNGATDQLFVSGLANAPPNFVEYNLTHFSGLFPNVLFPINSSGPIGASTGEGSGTSGIIVDNTSSSNQASSIYFGVVGLNTAVKLTQSGLN
jgi:hypothetical protein